MMSRLQPTLSTIKKLFSLSGNQCAHPECNNHLVNENLSLIGEICHICAAEEGGERYVSRMTDEERRAFENLILLCANCHIKTNDVNEYTIAVMQSMKSEHESKFINEKYNTPKGIIEESIKQLVMKQKNINTGGIQINNQSGQQNVNIFNSRNNSANIERARFINNDLEIIIEQTKTIIKGEKFLIQFRNYSETNHRDQVYTVSTKDLLFRKDNGRIKPEVKSYESTENIVLDEFDENHQNLLKSFLSKQDKNSNQTLKNSIISQGQMEPAIITCDGFLVNGNRRKMALEELYSEKQEEKYQFMKVVILPKDTSEKEIRMLENRYQLHKDGRSRYSDLSRAITLRDNMDLGISLRAQINDDPSYANLNEREIKKIEKDFYERYLNPLKIIDDYLKLLGRENVYDSIQDGVGDKDGRWEAFKDYSKFRNGILLNPSKRRELGIQEFEVGDIDDLAMKLIRKRDLKGVINKVHLFLRPNNLKNYLKDINSKKELFKINEEVSFDLPKEDIYDSEGNKFSDGKIDKIWGNRNGEKIIRNLVNAKRIVESDKERLKPFELIQDSLKKLNHENMNIEDLGN